MTLLGEAMCSRLAQSRGDMGERVGNHDCQEHHENIRSRIHDPRAVTRRAELLALLDDAVKITRSTTYEIAPGGGVSNDRRRDPERTKSTANEPAELALGRYGERRGHETEQDEPEAEHHRAAEGLPVACQSSRAVVPDHREREVPDTDGHEVQRNGGETLAEAREGTRGRHLT